MEKLLKSSYQEQTEVEKKIDEIVNWINKQKIRKDIVTISLSNAITDKQKAEALHSLNDLGISDDYHLIVVNSDNEVSEVKVHNSDNILNTDFDIIKEMLNRVIKVKDV